MSRLLGMPEVPPEQMTTRARAYLLATTAYCAGIGSICAFAPNTLVSVSFRQIDKMMPCGFAGWAIVHAAVGLTALIAAYKGRERWAWIALMGATGVVAPWAAGLFLAWRANPTTPATGVVAYSFITVIHLIQARQPLRSPFDPIFRSLSLMPNDEDE